jgi:uncharacterized Zn finger protein
MSTMDDTDLRLDGNAAAGDLAEVFHAEMTTAIGVCASCGAEGALGATMVYGRAPGTVIRCPRCTAVLICIVRTPDRLMVDIAGVSRLELSR